MKAEELRIGNYVQFLTSTIYIVDVVYKDYCMLENWNPIPLTEEWLLRFGFESVGELNPTYKLNQFLIELSLHEDYYTLRKIINKEESYSLKDIKYVNELQNLYFALTQRELTIT